MNVGRTATPHLAPNWKRIVMRAWSVRLMGLGVLVNGLDVAWPYFEAYLPISKLSFGLVAMFLSMGAIYARIKYQRNLRGVGSDEQA